MTNDKCFWQRWVGIALLIVAVASCPIEALAQTSYQNNSYRIYQSRPTQRVARTPAISQPEPLEPFRVEVADPPNPFPRMQQQPQTSNGVASPALSKAFNGNTSRFAIPSGRVEDVFEENLQQDIFGEKSAAQGPAAKNPFEKVESAQTEPQKQETIPENPFGEMPPQETQQQTPVKNRFNELPQDPTPIAPPMDTQPVDPVKKPVPPRLPDGSEFTPDPETVNPNLPVPGEDPPPKDDEPEEIPSEDAAEPAMEAPPETKRDKGNSVFQPQPEDLESSPVPNPGTRIYLPAKEPTDYVKSPAPTGATLPPGFDPRMIQPNPYANLPGPYGYPSQQPYATQQPYASYPPYPAEVGAMRYGQCGPGCTPTALCESCNSCNSYHDSSLATNSFQNCSTCNASSCDTSQCSGCNRCDTRDSRVASRRTRPRLPGSEIGERIVETSEYAAAAPINNYEDVVANCDEVCSNFASCYLGIFGGWSDLNDFATQGALGTGVYYEDAGYVFGVAVGQIQGRNLRTELELSYRNIDINGLRLDGNAPSQFLGVYGDFGTLSGMFNGYWEFCDFRLKKIKPYLGGGIGFALARPDLLQADGSEAVINNDESSFAWQWMGGLNYKASPTMDAFVEYRYFAADSFRLDTDIPPIAGLGNGSGSFDYRSSTVLFGLRTRF